MADSVTEVRSNDEGRDGRSVIGVHKEKCNWVHGNAMSRHRSIMRACLHGY